MAQIDPSIAMGFRPVQIESPINQMSAIAQLQGAQQQQQMNALKLREAQQLEQDRNELARIMSGNLPFGSDEFMNQVLARAPSQYEGIATRVAQREDIKERTAKREFETQKLQAELKQKRLEEFKTAQKDIAGFSTLDDAKADIQRKLNAGLLTPEYANNILAGMPADPAGYPAWQKRTLANLVSAEKQIDLFSPKIEKVDVGGAIKFIDINPNSSTFTQEVGLKSIAKTAAPASLTESPLTRLQRERAELAEKNPSDPRLKAYDEAIGKETGATMTAEQKSQAQDRDARRALERERLNLERYKAFKGDGSGSGIGPGTKLEKGERWNADEQRIETVPGSKLHVAQSNAHNKDRDALKAVETKAKSAITKIDELLSPKYIEGFRANFSGDIPYSGVITQYLAPDARRRIDSLKSDMKNAGLELIRAGGSIGQITEREWPIIEQMIAAITPDMTYQEAELQMKKVRAYLNKVQNNAKDSYQTEWGDTQYFKPTEKSGGGGGLSPADKQALDWANANPKDPRAAAIKQRLGAK